MKHRDRTDITASILRSAIKGVNKTKIMHESLMSFTQTNYYLDHLVENKVIRYDEQARLFKITDKGIKFLHTYEKISQLLSDNN
ncbi:MAG: hypothetical protein E6K98_02790 [Thaumarchaeota archaeon]|nr:MAG: hypothetical protein E6K98_02790 [Nitrososphaerota archaeon]TLX95407.1 MAG: hypothetical protein E6K91_02990 [Nitrososphaerota archaeon]